MAIAIATPNRPMLASHEAKASMQEEGRSNELRY
jgi:hypothetical protein